MNRNPRPGCTPSLLRPPSEEDTRRQLEGAVEVMEAARERYTALERCLSGRRWKRGLRERPGLLRDVPSLEPDVEEAQSRIQRRAESEQWPLDLPVRVLLLETLARRSRLEQRLRARLGEAAQSADGASTLLERIAMLEALAFQPDPRQLAPGEALLLEGKAEEHRGVETWAMRLLWCALFLYSFVVGWPAGHPARMIVPVGLIAVDLVLMGMRRGRYRLTRERLLWLPVQGEATQFPLPTLSRKDLQFHPSTGRVHVKGRHERVALSLLDAEAAHRLQLVLELHRHPPLLGAVSAGSRAEMVFFPATLEAGTVREGHAVLRPRAVAFLPGHGLVALLQWILGPELPFAPSPGDLPLVLEQWRHLSEDALDEVLERAVLKAGGEWWHAENVVRRGPQVPLHQYLHVQLLAEPAKSLRGRVDKRETEAAERILAAWPRR